MFVLSSPLYNKLCVLFFYLHHVINYVFVLSFPPCNKLCVLFFHLHHLHHVINYVFCSGISTMVIKYVFCSFYVCFIFFTMLQENQKRLIKLYFYAIDLCINYALPTIIYLSYLLPVSDI